MSDEIRTVSVIILNHNQGAYLREALYSVTESSYQNIEIIIYDDGSTDQYTLKVLSDIETEGCRVIRDRNRGPGQARDRAAAAVTGDYVLWLDADDTIQPSFIEKAAGVLNANPDIGFVYCHLRLFGDESGIVKRPPYNFYKLLKENYVQITSLFRRRAWQESGPNPITRGYEDWSFFIGLGKHGWHGRLLDAPLFNYRRHSQAHTNRAIQSHRQLANGVRQAHADIFEDPARLNQIRRQWGDYSLKEKAVLSLKSMSRNRFFPPQARRFLKNKIRHPVHALESAILLFYALFILTLPLGGITIDFEFAGLTNPWKWPHLFLATACLLSLARMLVQPRPRPNWFWVFLGMTALTAFLGGLMAPHYGHALIFAMGLLRGYAVVLPLAVIDRQNGRVSHLGRLIVVSAGLASALGVLQIIDFLTNLPIPQFPTVFHVTIGSLSFVRASAYLHDPNYFALLPAAGLLLYWLNFRPFHHKSANHAWFLLLATGLLLSFSRGSWLAVAITSTLYVASLIKKSWRKRQLSNKAAHAIIALALLIGVSANIFAFRGHKDLSSGLRLINMRAGIDTFIASPVLGSGLGSTIAYSPLNQVSHNLYLEIASGFGILGIIIWGVGLGMLILRLQQQKKGVAGLALIVLMLSAGLTLNLLTNLTFWLYLAFSYYITRRPVLALRTADYPEPKS